MVKKEVVRINREIERMERSYSGVTSLEGLPGCVFVVDPKKEVACVREVNKLGIPIIALIDTDANPDIIDYPIPGNDDSIKSVKYITSCVVEAINEGLKEASEIEKSQEEERSKAEDVTEEEPPEVSSSAAKIEEETPEKEIKKSTKSE